MSEVSRKSVCRCLAAWGLLTLGTATANTDLILDFGMGYDSNPNYLPTDARGTAVWSIHPHLFYRTPLRSDTEWFAQAGYQANGSQLDPHTIRLPSDPASPLIAKPPNSRVGWSAVGLEKYLSDDKAVSITVNALDHQHDNDDFDYRVAGISPDLRIMISDSSRLYWTLGWQRIMYANRVTLSSSDELQVDDESSVQMGLWHRMSPSYAADLSLRYVRLHSNEATVDSESFGTELRTIHLPTPKIRLTVALGLETERFDEAIDSEARTDRLTELSLGLEFKHTDSVSYSLTGTYSDHDSTFPDAIYKRAITHFNTSVTF